MHLAACSEPDFKVVAHTCNPQESRLSNIDEFFGMTCFDIAHHHRCKGVFTTIARQGKEYLRIRPKHPVCRFIADALETRRVSNRSTRGRPPSTLSSSDDDDYDDDFSFVGAIPATPITSAVHRTT